MESRADILNYLKKIPGYRRAEGNPELSIVDIRTKFNWRRFSFESYVLIAYSFIEKDGHIINKREPKIIKAYTGDTITLDDSVINVKITHSYD